jgi:hypothetical protein
VDEIRELTRRIDLLETQNRRMKKAVALILIIAGATLLMGQIPQQPNRITPNSPLRVEGAQTPPVSDEGRLRAQAFVLVDEKGKERASLVTDGGGSVFLVMFDKDGRPRADMQVSNFGPSINFYDPNARARLVIGSTTMVASHVSNEGIIEKNTPSSIVMFDAVGKLLWRTP